MIYIGSDHGGFELKAKISQWFKENEIEYIDIGATKMSPEDDYPDYAIALAEKVVQAEKKDTNRQVLGILICRSAGGVVIAANKVRGAKCTACFDEKMAKHAREHNDANILALSGDWTDFRESVKIIKAFLDTKFTEESRHIRRIEKIKKYESSLAESCCAGCTSEV